MILTKHNIASFFGKLCILTPVALTCISLSYLHIQQLKAANIHVGIKILYTSFKQQFNPAYAACILIIWFILCTLLFIYLYHNFYVGFDIKPFVEKLRGVKIGSINLLKKQTFKRNTKQLLLCGVPVPVDVENLHIMIAGSTGTGKSTILHETIASAIHRGDKIIIIDPNGGFLSKFYQEDKDHILNPFDARSEIWDPFFDIKNKNYDYEQLVQSIIPPQNSPSGEEWSGYARTLLRGLMRACGNKNIYTMHYIIELLNNATNEVLKQFLCGTEAEALFATSSGDGANNTITSTRFVLAKYISTYQHIPKNIGFGFSIRDYIDNGTGNLFITWREDMLQALKPMVSTFCDLISNAILSSNNEEKKLFIIDELGSLSQQPALEQLATKGRKHGVNIIACIQSTSQLNDIYGKEKAISLRSCFRNLVVLGGGSIDHNTANDLSTALGEHEVLRLDKTLGDKSSSRKKTAQKERIVLPSEIQALKQLEGYLAFTLDYPIVKFKIDRVDYPHRVENFIGKI